MNYYTFTTIISFLLIFPVLVFGQPQTPPTLYVDDDFDPSTPGWGVTHFDKINDAVVAATTYGTVILVYAGTYYENVEVKDKSLQQNLWVKSRSGSCPSV